MLPERTRAPVPLRAACAACPACVGWFDVLWTLARTGVALSLLWATCATASAQPAGVDSPATETLFTGGTRVLPKKAVDRKHGTYRASCACSSGTANRSR